MHVRQIHQTFLNLILNQYEYSVSIYFNTNKETIITLSNVTLLNMSKIDWNV